MKPMETFVCKKWEMLKCKSDQPCALFYAALPKGAKLYRNGCPREMRPKWIKLPTTELTV